MTLVLSDVGFASATLPREEEEPRVTTYAAAEIGWIVESGVSNWKGKSGVAVWKLSRRWACIENMSML